MMMHWAKKHTAALQHAAATKRRTVALSINQSINVTPVAMKLKKLMPAIH
jgi:hypothetical protein